jgi:UDP-glucose-4-epimerase GalE
MKVMVAGGAGYIGSHTVNELLKDGFEVVIFDDFSSGKQELIIGGEVFTGDLRNNESLKKFFKLHDVQAVLHFASLIQVGESYLDPQKYYLHNLMSTLNLLKYMMEAEVKKFIFSSSAAVYGIPEITPIPETHPLKPFNPYGRTKFFIEQILEDYYRAFDLDFISLRYFNAAGADPEGKLGEMHDPETHLIPNILLSLLEENKTLELYGADFPTPDGTAIRDYIHVTDLAQAHVSALKYLLDKPQSGCINLGTNKGYSVLEIIKETERITGKKVTFIKKPRREGDVPVLMASNQKAKKVLGWKPQYSDIETIIKTAWEWHSRIVHKKAQ